MKTTIEITNQPLFDSKIDEVHTDSLSGNDDGTEFYGNFIIVWEKGGSQVYTGEFAASDYEGEFGFKFILDAD